MATPATIDFDSLLAPISDASPCGVALKDDPATASLYYQIKDAREAARAAERAAKHAEWGDEGGPASASPARPDWQAVVRVASGALREKTKDLWISAWLLEGLARVHGFAGLRDGFHLVGQLCERYWDGIYPRPDDDGVASTVAQLAGLNGEGSEGALIGPIAAIAITQGSSARPLTGEDYADAENVSRTSDPDARAKRIAQGAATFEKFDAASRETSPEFFADLREDIAAAIVEFEQMTRILEEKCGVDGHGYSAAPPSSKIANALSESQSRVKALAGEPAAPPPEGGDLATTFAVGKSAGGSMMAREDAFNALLKVADYFRRTEPHSPVSYALEQAVRWGRMPLPELMRELVSDDSTRRELFRRTGIPMDSD